MKEKKKEEEEFTLPDEITKPAIMDSPDIVIISIPKMGKGTILGALTEKKNAIVLDLEKGGYDFIAARKLSAYSTNETTKWEAFQNYIKFRKSLLDNKGKYDFLIIDGLSDLDIFAEIGGTLIYQNSTIGKKFNRPNGDSALKPYNPEDPEWRSVLTLPDGAGL